MLDPLELLTLHAPAGNGQGNDPADIAALDDSLRRVKAYTPPPEYAAEPQRYATEPMIHALEKFQERNGLKVDGYANPGGPTERAINNRLLAKPRGAGLLFDPPASLAGRVGNGFDNRPGDVAIVQRLLGATGDLPEDPFDRPRGFIDENTTGAIKGFQRKNGLADDGWLAPGGETERALQDAVADLARANGRDWLAFAERAGHAQARMMRPSPTHEQPGVKSEEGPDVDEGRIEPAQSAPGDWIVPFAFLTLPGLLGLGEANRRRAERQRTDEGEVPGSKTELIPPRVPDEPFRGPDPAKPPIHPKLTQPSPYPVEPPYKPEHERIIPPRIDPRDYIEILPDQSDLTAHLPIIVENRQGSPAIKELNRLLGADVIPIVREVFPVVTITQTGGPTKKESISYNDEFDEFRFRKELEPTGWRPRWRTLKRSDLLFIDNIPRLHFTFHRGGFACPDPRRTDGLHGDPHLPTQNLVMQPTYIDRKETILLDGHRMLGGWKKGDDAAKTFIHKVWRILGKMSTNRVVSVDERTRMPVPPDGSAAPVPYFRAAHDALRWARGRRHNYLSWNGRLYKPERYFDWLRPEDDVEDEPIARRLGTRSSPRR